MRFLEDVLVASQSMIFLVVLYMTHLYVGHLYFHFEFPIIFVSQRMKVKNAVSSFSVLQCINQFP